MNILDTLLVFGGWNAAVALLVFMAASVLMVWRLDRMSHRGTEGTVLGALVMPYCSGMGNLLFAAIMAWHGGPGGEVIINSLVNNVTNFTLLLGLPALFWGLRLIGKKGKKRERQNQQVSRVSLMLTITAGLFFTGALWALSRDGTLTFGDGMVLVGLFFFWQVFEITDVLKNNIRQNRRPDPRVAVDFVLLLVGAYGLYCSIEWLIVWVEALDTGIVSMENLGWISGILMVLPNAGMALYYGWRRRADIVASSQLGDGHICIPLCIGLFALFHPIAVPELLDMALVILAGSLMVHFTFFTLLGAMPRSIGAALVAAYGVFLYLGLV